MSESTASGASPVANIRANTCLAADTDAAPSSTKAIKRARSAGVTEMAFGSCPVSLSRLTNSPLIHWAAASGRASAANASKYAVSGTVAPTTSASSSLIP